MKFIELGKEEQRNIIRGLKERTGMSEQILEKDWWVSAVMRALFALPYANQMSFKGGTSLSKCWGLIDRFSEDIDIAVAREFLGYGGICPQITDCRFHIRNGSRPWRFLCQSIVDRSTYISMLAKIAIHPLNLPGL